MINYRVSENPLSQNTSAVLLDSGNLIVRNEKFDILWQSFDYPSDTFFPVKSLTSWKSAEDPSLGTAQLKMDPKQPNEYFLMSGSQMVWRSGVWLSNKNIFAMIPEMRCKTIELGRDFIGMVYTLDATTL
ncbi:hypothetical protein QYF36_021066 [Acer negundo]|nr:hypothetical protein QYF36_021066 [Acer negundo]